MRIGKPCYCLLAAFVGAAVVFLKTYVVDDYRPAEWDSATWIAAIGVVVAFLICGILGCGRNERPRGSNGCA